MENGDVRFRRADVAGIGEIVYRLERRDGGFDLTVCCGGKTYTAQDVLSGEAEALALLDLLADGSVFPENVPEVLDDLLGVRF